VIRDALGALRPECVRQHFLGVFEAAAAAASSRHLAKLFQYGFRLAGSDFFQPRDGLADCLHFLVVQLLHQLATDLVSQSDQQYGRLLRPCDF